MILKHYYLGYRSSRVKGEHIPRVISQNAQSFRRWGFQRKVYTPSPSVHVKISVVQICFRLATFSAFIYWTVKSMTQITITMTKSLDIVRF